MDDSEHGGADVRLPDELTFTRSAVDLEAEFADFYRASVAKLIRFLVLQGAQIADAAEIAQEVMAKAWQSWPALESPMAWARVTASRALVRRIAAVEEDLIEDFTERSALLSTGSDIDEWIESDHYHQLVTALPPRQRQVMV
ncbi:RNA polymerase sigma factor [Nocardia paucivorans]|uniref:RNA polymerase sigma factor n=1 Tax=Nocardia paucivorans TaxID=114259 RepID=UPI00030A8594|nr:sigma factor [Nocardia paucivorans]